MEARKFTDKAKARFLGCLARGMRRGDAARSAGITLRCVQYHVRQDATLAEEIAVAEEQASEEVEDVLRQMALSGNLRAIILWLCNRCPERWKRNPQAVVQQQPSEQTPTIEELRARLKAALGITEGESAHA